MEICVQKKTITSCYKLTILITLIPVFAPVTRATYTMVTIKLILCFIIGRVGVRRATRSFSKFSFFLFAAVSRSSSLSHPPYNKLSCWKASPSNPKGYILSIFFAMKYFSNKISNSLAECRIKSMKIKRSPSPSAISPFWTRKNLSPKLKKSSLNFKA